ncbi:hypothetical protein B0H11DRAFT_51517 [Mycena galericulata]|nr:hypothetical protein B0H11DRAFT_51517 [Mycena galericulata]
MIRHRHLGAVLCAVAWCAARTFAANCNFATVVSGSTCFSIAQAAGITTTQLTAFNPGLDCSTLAIALHHRRDASRATCTKP